MLRHVRFPVPFSKRAEGFRVTCAKPWGNAGKMVPLLGEPAAKMKCGRCDKWPGRYYPARQSDAPGSLDVSRCAWHDIRIVTHAGGVWRKYFLQVSCRGDQMGEVVQFIRKPDPDRAARLIQEARAIYESIFPTEIASTAPIRDDDTSS